MCVRNTISHYETGGGCVCPNNTLSGGGPARISTDAREFNLADRARQSRKIRWLGTEEPQLVDDRGLEIFIPRNTLCGGREDRLPLSRNLLPFQAIESRFRDVITYMFNGH